MRMSSRASSRDSHHTPHQLPTASNVVAPSAAEGPTQYPGYAAYAYADFLVERSFS